MAITEWASAEVITKAKANNRGIRKGTETDLDNITVGERENGDYLFNSTHDTGQIQHNATNNARSNIYTGYDADQTIVTVTGVTATQVKDTSFIINEAGIRGNRITVVAEIKTSNEGTTGHFRVRLDGGGTDKLDLQTTSTSYEIKTGSINIGPSGENLAAGRHTIEIYMDDGSGDTITNRELEVFYN